MTQPIASELYTVGADTPTPEELATPDPTPEQAKAVMERSILIGLGINPDLLKDEHQPKAE